MEYRLEYVPAEPVTYEKTKESLDDRVPPWPTAPPRGPGLAHPVPTSSSHGQFNPPYPVSDHSSSGIIQNFVKTLCKFVFCIELILFCEHLDIDLVWQEFLFGMDLPDPCSVHYVT
jgi:hypothetical protein